MQIMIPGIAKRATCFTLPIANFCSSNGLGNLFVCPLYLLAGNFEMFFLAFQGQPLVVPDFNQQLFYFNFPTHYLFPACHFSEQPARNQTMNNYSAPGFEKNTNGIASGPNSAPMTPQNTDLAPRRFAI